MFCMKMSFVTIEQSSSLSSGSKVPAFQAMIFCTLLYSKAHTQEKKETVLGYLQGFVLPYCFSSRSFEDLVLWKGVGCGEARISWRWSCFSGLLSSFFQQRLLIFLPLSLWKQILNAIFLMLPVFYFFPSCQLKTMRKEFDQNDFREGLAGTKAFDHGQKLLSFWARSFGHLSKIYLTLLRCCLKCVLFPLNLSDRNIDISWYNIGRFQLETEIRPWSRCLLAELLLQSVKS